jgi:hypothetical protein
MTTPSEFPTDRIAVIEKQIDRLRKEVDGRISSNQTLWRAGLAGIGTLILLKESLDLSRLILLLPILVMTFISHWLNQIFTLYRSGDAMASCELRINRLAGQTLLEHETVLTHARRAKFTTYRYAMVAVGAAVTVTFWFAIWQVQPLKSAVQPLLLWQVGVVSGALVNVVAIANLWRFLSFSWPSLAAVENEPQVQSCTRNTG